MGGSGRGVSREQGAPRGALADGPHEQAATDGGRIDGWGGAQNSKNSKQLTGEWQALGARGRRRGSRWEEETRGASRAKTGWGVRKTRQRRRRQRQG